MSFREKSAWVTLITLIVLTTLFSLHVDLPWSLSPQPNGFLFHVLLLTIVTFVAVKVVAHVIFRLRSPRDARTPKDERERLIELKSRAVAFHVFTGLSLGSVFVAIHLVGANVIGMGYMTLWSFVAAEIVNAALRIYYYRRGF